MHLSHLGGDYRPQCTPISVVYQCKVSKEYSYIGISSMVLKKCLANWLSTFKYILKRNTTGLGKLIWYLKDCTKRFSLDWKKLSRSFLYGKPNSSLCTGEKLFILYSKHALINTYNERVYTCLHGKKILSAISYFLFFLSSFLSVIHFQFVYIAITPLIISLLSFSPPMTSTFLTVF